MFRQLKGFGNRTTELTDYTDNLIPVIYHSRTTRFVRGDHLHQRLETEKISFEQWNKRQRSRWHKASQGVGQQPLYPVVCRAPAFSRLNIGGQDQRQPVECFRYAL